MRGAIVALLLVAALSGAPSRASAGSNDLADPTVTPATGTTLTMFSFTVRYEGAFPATSVTAAVAGRDLAMTLTDGSMSAGTWAVSSTLPAGAWATTFIGYAEQGNVASVTGPALTVAPADATTPAPATSGAPAPSGPAHQREASRAPVAETERATTPVSAPADPAPSTYAEPSAAAPVVAPSAPDATAPEATAIPATAATGPPSVGGPAVPAGSAAIVGPSAVAVRSGTDSSQTIGMTRPTTDGTDELTHADDPIGEGISIVVLVGLLGLGAVALFGTAMLIARRRRAGDGAEPIAATAAAALQRRSVRRARQRMGEDPIMAAMGIGAEDQQKARRRPPTIDGDPT